MLLAQTIQLALLLLGHPVFRQLLGHFVRKTFQPNKKESRIMSKVTNRVRGAGLRLTGLILGIIAAVIAVTSIIFSAIGLHQSHLCKKCNKGASYQ